MHWLRFGLTELKGELQKEAFWTQPSIFHMRFAPSFNPTLKWLILCSFSPTVSKRCQSKKNTRKKDNVLLMISPVLKELILEAGSSLSMCNAISV